MENKPIAKVTGEDGNVFATLSICVTALKKAKMRVEADELSKKVFKAGSYDEALAVMSEYCELQ